MRFGIVLAGGRSSRMGRDKAAIVVEGEPLAARTARILAEVCARVIVVGAPGRALPELPPSVRVVFDEAPFGGPLAGLVAGLAEVPETASEPLLLLGVDLPRLHVEALRAFIAAAPRDRAFATSGPGGVQPFPSCLPLPAARDVAIERSRGPDRSLRGLLRALDLATTDRASLVASSPALAAHDPLLRGLDDADDEATLASLLAR